MTTYVNPDKKEIRRLERQVAELRGERDSLKRIVAELKAPLQELHSKQAEARHDLHDPDELEWHRQRAWDATGKVGLDFATLQVRETPADVWPEGIDPAAYVRQYYGLTPDGSRILYEDGGRSEAAQPVEEQVASLGTDISNTFIGRLGKALKGPEEKN
jgi:hypothetical protein